MKFRQTVMNKYDGLPLYKKLLVSLVSISIIPVLLIQVISFLITNSAMQKQTDDFTNLHLRQAYNHIDSLFSRYNSILADINNSEDILSNLRDVNIWSRNYYAAKNKIRRHLKERAYSEEGIIGIAIVATSGETIYYDSVSLSNTESFCLDVDRTVFSDMYVDAVQTKNVIYGYTKYVENDYGRRNIIYIAKQVVDLHNPVAGPMGVLVLSLDEAYLRSIYQDGDSKWNTSFITSKDGTVLSFPDKQYIGEKVSEQDQDEHSFHDSLVKFSNKAGLLDTDNLIINSLSKPNGEFVIVDVLDKDYMVSKIRMVSAVIVILGMMAILFAVYVTRYTSNKAKESVITITDAMEEANQGNLNATVRLKGNDEFAFIGRNFNHMLNEMKQLIHRNQQAMLRQKEAEIKALEAQINPHFLYNTLDAINWKAIEHDEHEISQMLKNLALILRYSIHNSNEIVTLREDLGYIRKYISLQQKRFDYSFDCILKIQEEAYKVWIHKLLVQPLVENALIHAFPGQCERDCIHINISLEKKQVLKIEITDNGVGMSQKLIDELNSYDYQLNQTAPSIGIRNVIARIKMYYGEKAQLFIRNNHDFGTNILITIPIPDKH